MRIVPIDELNLNADYQLVNGGRGLLGIYALGRKTESHHIGELAMRTLAVALENLDGNRAQQLVLLRLAKFPDKDFFFWHNVLYGEGKKEAREATEAPPEGGRPFRAG